MRTSARHTHVLATHHAHGVRLRKTFMRPAGSVSHACAWGQCHGDVGAQPGGDGLEVTDGTGGTERDGR